VITGQLTAFLNRDAEQAWQFAHPSIQAQFQSPDVFIRMVQQGYEPLMNFVDLAFQKTYQDAGVWVQTLMLRDTSNERYLLTYSLVENPTGELKIAGVWIERDTGI
jgi:hypothetical protein